MILCIDVHYNQNSATAAAITATKWPAESPCEQFQVQVADVGDYQPGSFYLRELKPITEVIKLIQVPVQYFVIDAYCHLSESGTPGLGHHLHATLPNDSVVIGVAKNRYRDTTHAVELCRGNSTRPLYITSIGVDYRQAAKHIEAMAGEHRMPTLLKLVDRLSRSVKDNN